MTKLSKYLLAIFLLTLGSLYGRAQGDQTAITVPINAGGTQTYQALLHLPDDYNTTLVKYPLLVFLHGLGEQGSDLSIIYNSSGAGGPAYEIAHGTWPSSFTNPVDGKAYKFIVVSPQCPTNGSTSATQLSYVLKYLLAQYRVDTNRVYITGLSEGGQGVVEYLGHYMNTPLVKVAAATPMSAAIGQPQQSMINASVADSVHVWGFGSTNAPNVDGLGVNTRCFVQGAFGGNCGSLTGMGQYGRFTAYGQGHCCWQQFYTPSYTEVINGTAMNQYQWMLQYSRAVTVPVTFVPSPPYAPPATVNITSVGVGEYQTTYLTSDGRVHAWLFNTSYFWGDFGLSGVVEDIGAQYDNIVRLNDGTARRIRKADNGGASVITIPVDTFGNAFNYVQHVYGFWQSYLFIAHDSVYYLGTGNNQTYGSLGLAGNAVLTKPMPLGQPGGGRKVIKLVTFDNASSGMAVIMALCNDGTVWNYFYGSTTPTQQTGLSGKFIIDIAGITRAGYVAITTTDILAWGPFSGYFQGLSDGVTTPTSILSSFTAQGLVMPLKQAVPSWNTLHLIDANSNMFAEGDNAQGEIGNGIQINPWATYKNGTSSAPFAWDFSRGSLMQTVTQIPGKFTNLCGGSNIAFLFFVQDIGAATGANFSWYSWGRDKQDARGDGRRAANDDIYNCALTCPAPAYVSPASVAHLPDFTFAPTNTFRPYANAGVDQYISTSTGTLNGTGSSQPEGSIASYLWTKIGGSVAINSPTNPVTTLSGLASGSNLFKLTVTSNTGLVAVDTINVIVSSVPPNVSAGSNQFITLPTNSVLLTGTASGNVAATIVGYLWTQQSGPTGATIASPGSIATMINNLVAGTYVFQLRVTDSNGLTNTANVSVFVFPAAGPGVVPHLRSRHRKYLKG